MEESKIKLYEPILIPKDCINDLFTAVRVLSALAAKSLKGKELSKDDIDRYDYANKLIASSSELFNEFQKHIT